jgi:N-acetylmuramoyl-L-alanine amidase
MKFATALLLLTCAFHATLAATPLRAERLWMFGNEYYRLDQWAQRNGFKLTWLGAKEVQLTKGSTRVTFTGNSRRMMFNGVLIVLSHDIVTKNGIAYITPLDVNSTLNPLLWPARSGPKEAAKHICLDPGHGGRDIGQHSGGEHEKKYTLLLAQELAQQLRKAGYTVSLTRSTDVYLELDERAEIARRRGADLFVSLHFNSAGLGGRDVRGVETYCLTPARANSTNDPKRRGNTGAVTGNRNDAQNMLLAYEVHKALVRSGGSDDRGVKRARFEVLRSAAMPAVLVEAAFLSNPADAKKIFNAAWRRQVAESIVAGIRSYRSQTEK